MERRDSRSRRRKSERLNKFFGWKISREIFTLRQHLVKNLDIVLPAHFADDVAVAKSNAFQFSNNKSV
jgi:hypothetical protein